MTKFYDFSDFFFKILDKKHPNITNTGIRLSKMNFLRMKMLKLTRRGAGLSWYIIDNTILSHTKIVMRRQ